ncbi:GNAT family N-acetyltransferase [Jeongeupia chitinilytica]|uniref:Histone acetyltransferase n=1 Tax=Jeongeupia chitinilytica TaxID=1041641 RepID=A0ABQ3GXZ6_9NEIS|nr:GNAT family N-acetyltransferase [Jeongeupia chitinilytica]GHD56280.1 histone acetyltransferase [Jeongeupia chitinilytica]
MVTTLRAAGAQDASAVARILIDTRAAFMPYAPAAHSDDEIREWVAHGLVPGGGLIVAERDGRIVGAMATGIGHDGAWITQMAVNPAQVGHGVGSELLAHALRTLPRPIRLHTFQANLGARRFYERFGFVATVFSDGRNNEERCPDILYVLAAPSHEAGDSCQLQAERPGHH